MSLSRPAVARRRLLLMRHGEVDYFDATGRPVGADDVPLTRNGRAQARAIGEALARHGIRLDRAVTSGMRRTRETAALVLEAMQSSVGTEHWPELHEIRGGRLSAIPEHELNGAFLAVFQGPVDPNVRFLGGETVGALIARVLPPLERLLADPSWDTALAVLHGGVNRVWLSWFLTGRGQMLGGLAQDPGCLNVIDVGTGASDSVVRVLNYGPEDPLRGATRLTTMEELLERYRRYRPETGQPER